MDDALRDAIRDRSIPSPIPFPPPIQPPPLASPVNVPAAVSIFLFGAKIPPLPVCWYVLSQHNTMPLIELDIFGEPEGARKQYVTGVYPSEISRKRLYSMMEPRIHRRRRDWAHRPWIGTNARHLPANCSRTSFVRDSLCSIFVLSSPIFLCVCF